MQRGEKLSGRSVSKSSHRWFGKPLLMVACAGLFAALIGLAARHSGWMTGWRVNAAGVSNSIGSDKVWKATVGTTQERQVGSNLPPLPDGNVARFRIVDSPVLAAELTAQYSQIKSYRGQA